VEQSTVALAYNFSPIRTLFNNRLEIKRDPILNSFVSRSVVVMLLTLNSFFREPNSSCP